MKTTLARSISVFLIVAWLLPTVCLTDRGQPAAAQVQLLAFLPPNVSPDQTPICGTLTDSHWTLAGSPYVVTCNSSLDSGSLIIDPGVSIQFQAGTRMDIFGTLVAEGTPDTLITFTSSNPTPSRGDWNGLRFQPGSNDSILRHVIVEYGMGIFIDGVSPVIDYVTTRYHASSGISLSYSQSTVTHSTIISNTASTGGGVYAAHGNVTLDSNTIMWNTSFERGGGIRVYGFPSGAATVTNNTVSHNSTGSYGGGGIIFDGADGLISNNIVTHNSSSVGCGGGIQASGAAAPVVTIEENTIVDNTSGGDGGGICTDVYATITGNLIAQNTTNGVGGGLVYIYPSGWHGPSEIPVTCNTIIYNTGLSGVDTRVLSPYHQNTIYGNTGYQFAVGIAENPSGYAYDVDATQNYWLTTDPGQIAAGIYDHDNNPNLGTVTYSPFSSAPDSCAPVFGTAYSISGRVTDASNHPVPNVDISDGAGSSVMTDDQGNYTFSDLAAGTYTLTASRSGYTFTPPSRTTAVPPDATGQDFLASVDTGRLRVAVLVQVSEALDADETNLASFVSANSFDYEIVDARMIREGSVNLFDFQVLCMRTGSQPVGYAQPDVVAAIRSRVQAGASLILEFYGLYLAQYLGLGTISLGWWDPVITDATYYVEGITPSDILAPVLPWSPPVEPDRAEQLIARLNDPGVYGYPKLEFAQAPEQVDYWFLLTNYGWCCQTTTTDYCLQHPGVCTTDRSVHQSNGPEPFSAQKDGIRYVPMAEGIVYSLGLSFATRVSAVHITVGPVAEQIRRNIIRAGQQFQIWLPCIVRDHKASALM